MISTACQIFDIAIKGYAEYSKEFAESREYRGFNFTVRGVVVVIYLMYFVHKL